MDLDAMFILPKSPAGEGMTSEPASEAMVIFFGTVISIELAIIMVVLVLK
jgi:nitrogen fixation protein FixH